MADRRDRWTAGQLRAVLARIPDDTPLRVSVSDPDHPDEFADWAHVVTGAGRGEVRWADERGTEETSFLVIETFPADDDDADF